MKKILATLVLITAFISLHAQEEGDQPRGFRKDMLFTGGNLNVGFFNGVTVLGATPQLGYSVANWLDAGIVLGYTYTSQSDVFGTKYRQTIIGPGAFVRLFPVDFLFATAQFEHNFLRLKVITPGATDVSKTSVSSLLVGLGYTSGKQGRNTPYYYFSVSVDVLNNPASPYRTFANEIFPVVNAGFNIPLFQGSGKRR